jgi:vacuolar-type H+-ATPase subunit D/Vma8
MQERQKPIRLEIVSRNPTVELLQEIELLQHESENLIEEHFRLMERYDAVRRELEKLSPQPH